MSTQQIALERQARQARSAATTDDMIRASLAALDDRQRAALRTAMPRKKCLRPYTERAIRRGLEERGFLSPHSHALTPLGVRAHALLCAEH